MLNLLVRWMEKRGCFRMIRRRNPETGFLEDYLYRGHVLRFRNFGLMIHQFCGDDPDELHSHPWWSFTFILKGGYYERGIDGIVFWRPQFFFRLRAAEELHRITLPEGGKGKSWSLFGHFRRYRQWGFLTPEGWVDADEYGKKFNSPVEGGGVDYRIVGHVFPRVVRITPEKL